MSLETLKKLRFLIPGIIILVCLTLLGRFTGDWKILTSLDPEDVVKTISAIVFGFLYHVTPLRNWANRRNYNDVNSNITKAMVEIGEADANSDKSSWAKVRRLFYRIVNSDDSLKVQSSRAYFNGLLWTSTADLRAISIIFFAVSIFYHFAFASQGALMGVIFFFLIAALTLPISWAITERHKKIGKEQIEIIRDFHSQKVKDYFDNE